MRRNKAAINDRPEPDHRLTMPALNIVSEKEFGTIEKINVTPVSKFTFILAKLIPYWVAGMLILTISIILAWLVYGLVPAGHLWLLYFFAFCSLSSFRVWDW